MLKKCVTGTLGALAAASVLTLALVVSSPAQQEKGGPGGGAGVGGGGPSAGPSGGPRAAAPGGGERGNAMPDRAGRMGSSTFSGREEGRAFSGRARGRTYGYGEGRRLRGRNGVYIGESYGYDGGCGYLRHRALVTGSPYWWRRFRICRGG
jgi:hypothetical protein